MFNHDTLPLVSLYVWKDIERVPSYVGIHPGYRSCERNKWSVALYCPVYSNNFIPANTNQDALFETTYFCEIPMDADIEKRSR